MTTARETTMKTPSLHLMLVALSIAGCTGLEISNDPPVAVAKIMVGGTEYASGADIPYMGAPAEVTLDARSSTDKDGTIVEYEWLRTDVSNTDRYGAYMLPMPVPRFIDTDVPPAYAGDPGRSRNPTATVSLPEGTHQFSLWVTDNDKELSIPATVTVVLKTPSIYMPDATCMGQYENAMRPMCEECLCSPNATMGCLEEWNACANNADPMFNEMCLAIVNCSIANMCSGATCYAPEGCMAEIDAASAFAGLTVAMCAAGDPLTNPCTASSRLGNCTSGTPEAPGPCRAVCAW